MAIPRREFISLASLPLVASSAAAFAAPLAAADGPQCGPAYALDPDQTPITARGQALRDYVVPHDAGSAAQVTAAIVQFESRFRRREATGWLRKRVTTGEDLRLVQDSATSLVQAVADYNALWSGAADLPQGRFELGDSVFVTHGLAFPFSTGRLVGAGLNIDGSAQFGGTTLVATRIDRPAIICQGGRKDRIANLSLVGPLRQHIFDNGLGTAATKRDDSQPAAWDAGGISDQRWAPFAGIAIDPFADPPPPSPYPRISAPAYLGPAPKWYRREPTSDVSIERVMISGFNVALVVHPAAGVAQGDYIHAQDLMIEACKYGVSIGNTQSRLPTGLHRHIARVFCGFTNRLNGAQQGFLAGIETNAEVGACTKVFDFDLSFVGNFTFDGLYSEACWTLGDVRGTTMLDGGLTIRGAHLNLSYASGDYVPLRGVPKHIIGDPDNPRGYAGTGQVAISNTFLSFRTACPLMVKNLSLDRVQLYSLEASVRATSLARAIAHNGSMGLLMPPGTKPTPAVVTAPRFDLATLATGATHTTDDNFRQTDRNALVPWFVGRARPKSHSDDRYAVPVPMWQFEVPANKYGVRAVRGIEIELAQPLTRDQANNTAQAPGCLVLHDWDGRWYYVKSRDYGHGTVVLEALTDYHDPGTGDALRTQFANTGALLFVETRFYTPAAGLVGDVAQGSPVVSNVRLIDGTAPAALDMVGGDYLWVDPNDSAPAFTPATNRIDTVDSAGFRLTMSGPARRSQTGMRIGLLIRGS